MTKWTEGSTENGYGKKGIILEDGDIDRVISLCKEDGKIVFREECDGYFSVEMTKEEAIIALEEAIQWVSAS